MASEANIPNGFKKIPTGQADAFFQPREGAEIRGILLGMRTIAAKKPGDAPRDVYQIELTAPCDSVKLPPPEGSAPDADWIDGRADVGKVVALDNRSALEGLEQYTKPDANPVEIWARCGKRKDLPGKRHFWPFEAAIREL